MKAKERHRQKLIEYIGDPDNDFPTRNAMAVTVCGVARKTLYATFTPEEFTEIEKKGLILRRSKYSRQLSAADKALMKKAEEGDVAAIKLMYQRFEVWSEKHTSELRGKVGMEITEISIVLVSPAKREEDNEPLKEFPYEARLSLPAGKV